MKQITYIFIFTLTALFLKGQVDSIPIKKSSKLIHLIGVGVGYKAYKIAGSYQKTNSIMQYYGELDFNYVLSGKKYFFTKAQFNIAPTKNFNMIINATAQVGFTTNMQRKLSWHLSMGLGIGKPSKKYVENTPLSFWPYQYTNNYSISLNGPFVETGFYFKPFKTETKYIGANLALYSYFVSPTSYPHGGGYGEVMPCLFISYNHRLFHNK